LPHNSGSVAWRDFRVGDQIAWRHRTMSTAENTKTSLNVLGHPTEMLLTAAESGGNLSVARMEIPPGWGNPVHVHWFEDEAFYILSGELDITVDGATARFSAGQMGFGPNGRPHAFKNPTDTTTTMLVITTPGGIERFFRACDSAFPDGKPSSPEGVVDIIERHGMSVVH